MEQLLPGLRDVGHRAAGAARRPRRPEAGAPPHPLDDVRRRASAPTATTSSAPASPATSWATTTPTATQAIYDALVRMAQPFSLRHPLIDFHGNYGSPDFPPGGPALHRVPPRRPRDAAARRHRRGHRRFSANYDGQATGAERPAGAVPQPVGQRQPGHRGGHGHQHPAPQPRRGHRRRRPPARPSRRHRRRSHAVRQGPRLPDRRASSWAAPGIIDAYRTGRGSIRMRAGAEIEEMPTRRQRSSSPSCPTRLAGHRSRDASTSWSTAARSRASPTSTTSPPGESTRLVIELKRDANANVVLNNLFKHTALQSNFAVNMVALVDGVPRTLNLRDLLGAYIDAPGRGRPPPLSTASQKARERAHIVEGLLRAIDMIDAIIAAIRGSEDRAAAREGAHGRAFEFSDDPGQAHPRHAARAADPARPRPTSRTSWPSCGSRSPSSRRSWATRRGCAASSRTSWP